MEQKPHQDTPVPGSVFGIRLLGVPVRFHFTFVLLAVFLAAIGLESPSGAQAAIYLMALFASVLLHELGHSVTSKHYGIRTVEIVMFPIGGVARLERNPKPREELWIALAGPAVNVMLAGLLVGAAKALAMPLDFKNAFARQGGNLILQIAIGNIVLAAFNLLPAFPMDGGRLLRALLAMRRGEVKATEVASGAGRMLAILMGLYGLISANFFLVFIAFFVYLGAAQENAAVLSRTLTEGIPVSAAMITDFRTLSHGQTIRDAANLLLSTSQQDFPVVYGEQVLGLLGRNSLLRAMANEGPDAYVSGIMDRAFLALHPGMDLSEAMPMLLRAGNCALVMDEQKLLGLLTSENLSEFLLLRKLGMRPLQ